MLPVLSPASFNGLPFHVERDEVDGGHRVTRTQIPNGSHVLESFGPKAREFKVTAYCTGPAAYAMAEALLKAGEAMHRGMLVLPGGARMVRLTRARKGFEKDKLPYATVEIEAWAEPSVAPGISAGGLASQIFAAGSGLASALGSFVAQALLPRLAGATALIAAVSAGARVVGALAALRTSARLTPAAEAVIAPEFAALNAALPALPAAPEAFGQALAGAAIGLADVAQPAALAALIIASGPPPSVAGPLTNAASAVEIARLDEAGATLVSVAHAIAFAEAAARMDLVDRDAGITLRAQAEAVFADAIGRLTREGGEIAAALSAQRGLVADLAIARAETLAPVITVSAPARLPALWWAWQLHADPFRAEAIARRARAPHPALMPARFEALAF